MFASSMKILTFNTNTTSPIAQVSSGTKPNVKVFNDKSERVGSGASGSNYKLNKRDQKHNSKTIFTHTNSNKMQQHIQQQQQLEQTQKYHNNKNNSNNNNNGGKLRNQHYNNINNNSTSSLNRKKYYQQQHHQQQQQQKNNYQKQQQQQYIMAMQQTISSSQTITNNNNSILVKNQNYSNIDLPTQEHKQNSLNNNNNNNTNATTDSVVNHTTNLIEACTCVLQQSNCDKLSVSSPSSGSLSATASSSLITANSDYHRHNICHDKNFKTSVVSSTKTSVLNAAPKTASSASDRTTCWSNFTKLRQQQLQVTTCANFKSPKISNSVQEFESSAVRTTSTSLSSTSSGCQSLNSTISSSASKKKKLWKNSNNIVGGSAPLVARVNYSLSSAGLSSGNIAQSLKLSKEKEHHVADKSLSTNTSKNLGKPINNNNGKDQKYNNTLAVSGTTTQKSKISKEQPPSEEYLAMTTSLSTKSGGSTTETTLIPNTNSNIASSSSSKSSTTISTHQQGTLENFNESNEILKPISNNSKTKYDIKKPTTTTSSPTTKTATISSVTKTSPVESSQKAYSLDFLHSVGVKVTGVEMRSPGKQGPTNGCGNQSESNLTARNNYSHTGMTAGQRQPRYMYGGSNNNNLSSGNQQQHYHHHQPQQLTIASFLNQDVLKADNVLSNTNNTGGSSGNFSSTSNSRNTNNNCNNQQLQRNYTQQQSVNHSRYYHNYSGGQYQQQSGGAENTNYGGVQRNSGYGYTNYHNAAGDGGIGKNDSMTQQQHPRQIKSNNVNGSYRNSVNNCQTNKKPSYASSITSTSSSSSSKSISSNSTKISNRQLQTVSSQESNKSTTNSNLPIETLATKILNGTNQRSNHRGHHNHYSNHHQNLLMNSPNVLQHQNYYNLTYVATDGSKSRACSPAQHSLPPKPSSKSVDNSPGHVAMLMNFNANSFQYPHYPPVQPLPAYQQQQLHQFQARQQHQNFFGKKVFVPLSLNMPSPSPSPTPLPVNLQQASLPGNNIRSCSQLDDATTAAVAATASSSSSGIIAGNDCDSDTSSNHSSQLKYHSLKPIKPSSVSSTSASSIPIAAQQAQQQTSCSQPATAVTCGPTTPLHSPLDYNYSTTATQTLNNLQTPQQSQMPQYYGINSGAVISLHNIPAKSQNIYTDEEYQQQLQQHHQLYFNATANQRTHEILNIPPVTNCSNNGSGYWSPTYHNNQFVYHQASSAQVALMPTTTSSSSSCGSSSASISPRLANDELQPQTQQRQHNNCGLPGSSLSPSPCNSLNEQFSNIIIGNISSTDSGLSLVGSSPCSSNSSSVSGCSHNRSDLSINSINGGQSFKTGSSQLLPKQQRLIAQQTYQSSSSSTSSLSSSSASTLTSAVRARIGAEVENGLNTNNIRNNQLLQQLPQTSITASVSNNVCGTQQLPPTTAQHIYSHHHYLQQQQSLPPPLPPHNLLYNSPQIHQLRALNSSAIHDFFSHTPPDRFLARAHLIEAKETPHNLLNNSKWDHLSQDIWKKFTNTQQTVETFKQKMRLWRYLYLFIKNAYPRYGLYLVGSTISGFGSDSSDVDMCLVSRSASSIDPRLEALFNLTVLRDCLSKSDEFENFNLIEAKVPILRFSDRMHQLEVDLNFNNCVGIKNTHLLYCYSQLDWRLRPLVLVTKLWAQYHNINNAKNMTISSYSLVLMVIHFLQYALNPPVLPCLHQIFPDKFPLLRSNDFGYVDMGETMGPYDSKNTQCIGELFLLFLEYYSFFDYTQFAISVRTGGLLPINECRVAKSPKNDVHQWKELCIEEPFDLTNTARSVYDYETFERVKLVFISSWRILQETLDLNSVFSTTVISSSCSTEIFNPQNPVIYTAGFSEIGTNVDDNESQISCEQHANDFSISTITGENYKENNKSSSKHDNAVEEESIISIDGSYTDEGDDTATNSSFIPNNNKRKLVKYKDLNRTLTPPKNNKDFGENKFPFASSSSDLNCTTTGTKNVHGSNDNNKTATHMIS